MQVDRGALATRTQLVRPALQVVRERGFLGIVRQVLRDELELGIPTVAATARRMRIANRTLQRRLHEEGTTFHDLLESVRCEIACDRLRRSERKILEVAWELQYADESAFVRAFKRWKGITPGVYRKQSACAGCP